MKLPSSEVRDVRLGRSIISIHIPSFKLRIINEQHGSFIPAQAHPPNSIDCNDGRSIQMYPIIDHQYFQSLLIRNQEIHSRF